MSESNKKGPKGLGYIVYKRTYSRPLKGNKTEEFEDTAERIIKACRTQLKVGFTHEEEDFLRELLLDLKGSVAGRFMWQLGTTTVDTLGLASLQNCFGREVEFLTKSGIRSFSDFKDGDKVTIRGRNSWKEATVKCFGKGNLTNLVLSKGSRFEDIRTTDNHRWILADNSIKTTAELNPGDRLQVFTRRTNFHNLKRCPIGIQHGLVYGDGNWNGNANACAITICGDSIAETKAYFSQHDTTKKEISGLPWTWKQLPELEHVNKHYLFGFLSGWFAADGSVSPTGQLVLANKCPEVLRWARGALSKLDITASAPRILREKSPFDGSDKPMYRISIDRENLPREFLLLAKHDNRYRELRQVRYWTVKDIQQNNDHDELWCISEPENEEFTLVGGILTKNCAATVIDHPVRPFTWAMDMLMLGCGVGYNLQREYIYEIKDKIKRVKITRKDTKDADFIVPDSREGWVELLKRTLEAHFFTGKGFTYSTVCIRGKGAIIAGFGGTASGPEILCKGMEQINGVLNKRSGKKLRPIDALDVMNIIGSIVVAGNIRRSAQISIGDYDDLQFLNAKRWDLGNIPNWRAMSNNSIVCNSISDLPEQFWEGYEGGGEPYGLINLKLSRGVGRAGDSSYPDPDVIGYNPCAEQPLAAYETCCLAEIYLPNIESSAEFNRVARTLYRINKHSLALDCHHPETERIVHSNYRMGIGVTGYLQSSTEQRSWLSGAYDHLRQFDKEYSKERGLPVSIKLTTVKPSGSLSLLAGVTPGVHPGYSTFFIRRVRMLSDSQLVEVCRKSGYHVEYVRNFDGTEDKTTVVVEFPSRYPDGTVVAKDLTAVDQLNFVKELQTNWSDNAVSCTVYYKKDELPTIRQWLLSNYDTNIKSCSFLLHSDHGFDQAPYEEITEKQYLEKISKVLPINSVKVSEEDMELDGCDTGQCPIK